MRLLTEAEGQRLGAQGINPLHVRARDRRQGSAPLKTLARGSAVGPDSALLTCATPAAADRSTASNCGTRWARFEGRDRNTWPKLDAPGARVPARASRRRGAFGTSVGIECGEVVCDERLIHQADLMDGTVHCLVSLPTLRAGEIALVHDHASAAKAAHVRSVASHRLPAGTRMTVHGRPRSRPDRRHDPSLDDTVPRRTLAQELFGTALEARARRGRQSRRETARSEAATARRLDLNLVARLYGELDRRGQRF